MIRSSDKSFKNLGDRMVEGQGVPADGDEFRACRICACKCREIHGKAEEVGEQTRSTPSFWKLIRMSHIKKNFMRIPIIFMEEYGYRVGDNVVLQGPGGYTIDVGLSHDQHFGFARAGWRQFLRHHNIEVDDYILCTLIADSYFTVKIFNKTGCEKPLSAPSMTAGGGSEKLDNLQVGDDGNWASPAHMQSAGEKKPSPHIKTPTRTEMKGGVKRKSAGQGEPSLLQNAKKHCTTNGETLKDCQDREEDAKSMMDVEEEPLVSMAPHSSNRGVSDTENKKKIEENESSTPPHSRMNGSQACMENSLFSISDGLPQEVLVTGSQKLSGSLQKMDTTTLAALQSANAFKSKNPSTVLVVNRTAIVNNSVYFPKDFAKKWFPKQKAEIQLVDADDNRWSVTSKPCMSHTTLAGGWKRFVIEQGLEEGDVLVFELKNPNKIALQVHFFRKSSYVNFGEGFGEAGGSSVQDQEKIPSSKTRLCGKISQTRRRPPTEVEREKAWEAANAIQTKQPSVLVTMKPSHVCAGFSMPISLKEMPDKTTDAILKDPAGQKWPAKWLVNAGGKRFSAGWKRFVTDHNLEEGDVCVFELIDSKELTLLIHISRIVMEDDPNSPPRALKSRGLANNLTTQKNALCTSFQSKQMPRERQPEAYKSPMLQKGGKTSFLSLRRPVTEKERRQAETAARALKTANPSAVVVLTNSSVYRHFIVTLPNAFKDLLPQKHVTITLLDVHGQKFKARWTVNDRAKLLKSFKRFSLSHCLEEGDVCVFEFLSWNPENPVFRVHIFRVVDLEGGSSCRPDDWRTHYQINRQSKPYTPEMPMGLRRATEKMDLPNLENHNQETDSATATGSQLQNGGSQMLDSKVSTKQLRKLATKAIYSSLLKCKAKSQQGRMEQRMQVDAGNVSAPDPKSSIRRLASERRPLTSNGAREEKQVLPLKVPKCEPQMTCLAAVRPTTEHLPKIPKAEPVEVTGTGADGAPPWEPEGFTYKYTYMTETDLTQYLKQQDMAKSADC